MKQMATYLPSIPLLLLALISGQVSAGPDQEGGRLPFGGRSFGLRTIVSAIGLQSELGEQFRLTELYSHEQRRAKLTWRRLAGEGRERGTIYANQRQRAVLLLDGSQAGCRLLAAQEALRMLHLDWLQWPARRNLKEDAPEYVLGAGQLLYLVEKRRSSLKLASLASPVSRVRNLQTVAYSLELDGRQLEVHYSEAALAAGHKEAPPVLVLLMQPGANLSLAFEFFPEAGPTEWLTDGEWAEESRLDELAYEPASGCALALEAQQVELFASRAHANLRFSFHAQAELFAPPDQQARSFFAAYDSRVDALRLDEGPGAAARARQLFDFARNRLYHQLEGAEPGESAGCLATRIFPSQRPRELALSVGRLLVGADRFVHIGRARVRKLAANVYESFGQLDAGQPFWLERALVYRAPDGAEQSWPATGNQSRAPDLSLLAYFAADNPDQPLLLLEIYRYDQQRMVSYAKQSIHFHHFFWDLDSRAPNGDLLPDFFSLRDRCSPEPAAGHAQLELQLRTEQPPAAGLIEVASARNLALLAALQETLQVPAAQLFDLESRLQPPSGLLVWFRLAEQSAKLTELHYLGEGHFAAHKRARFKLLKCSLRECFLQAAHRDQSPFFAYTSQARLCRLPEATGKLDNLFVLEPGSPLEIFKLEQVEEPGQARATRWIRNQRHNFQFLGRQLSLRGLYASNDPGIPFKVSQVRWRRPDERAPEQAARSFAGLGLQPDRPPNWPVQAAADPADQWRSDATQDERRPRAMSFERCQMACLADFHCSSFSVCIRRAELSCVLSSSSFDSDAVGRQLAALAANKSSSVSAVQLDDGHVQQLVRHPNCQLVSKNHLDLFDRPPVRVSMHLGRRLIHPVRGQEHCAELCVRVSLRVLEEERRRAQELARLVQTAHSEQQLAELLARPSAKRLMCRAFLYLDRQEALANQVELDARIQWAPGDAPDRDSMQGYCALGDRLLDTERDQLDPQAQDDRYTSVERYTFQVARLFERQFGVRLRASPLSGAEEKAHRQLVSRSNGEPPDPEAYALLRRKLELGDNLQQRIAGDEAKCALVCFINSQGPWPACRSFEVATVLSPTSGRQTSECRLNSIDLRQAIRTRRFDLIETDQQQVWHYEPQAELALDQSSWSGRLVLAELDRALQLHLRTLSSHLAPFWTATCLLAGLASGLLLGLALANRWAGRRTGAEERRLVQEVQFSNQVNSEGQVPD